MTFLTAYSLYSGGCPAQLVKVLDVVLCAVRSPFLSSVPRITATVVIA